MTKPYTQVLFLYGHLLHGQLSSPYLLHVIFVLYCYYVISCDGGSCLLRYPRFSGAYRWKRRCGRKLHGAVTATRSWRQLHHEARRPFRNTGKRDTSGTSCKCSERTRLPITLIFCTSKRASCGYVRKWYTTVLSFHQPLLSEKRLCLEMFITWHPRGVNQILMVFP